MSSSEEEKNDYSIRQSGKNYTLDLQAFSGSKIRLETELRNSYSSIEILDTYCTDGVKYNDVNPLLNPDGANPLITEFYQHDYEGAIMAPWGKCACTDEGQAFKDDMAGDGAEHTNECTYGDFTEGTPFPSPKAIHHWPAKAWRNINAYYIRRNSTGVYSGSN